MCRSRILPLQPPDGESDGNHKGEARDEDHRCDGHVWQGAAVEPAPVSRFPRSSDTPKAPKPRKGTSGWNAKRRSAVNVDPAAVLVRTSSPMAPPTSGHAIRGY